MEEGHVWIKPSLRPKKPLTESDIAANAMVADLVTEILGDAAAPTKEYKEPEHDWADLERTTMTRDMLVEQVQRLNALMVLQDEQA